MLPPRWKIIQALKRAISGVELTDKMRRQAERFGAEIYDEEIIAIGMEGLCKIIETHNEKHRAKSLSLHWSSSRLLNTPGEEKFTEEEYPIVLPVMVPFIGVRWLL